MARRLMRFRAGLAGCAAVLASAVLAATPMAAPAAHAQGFSPYAEIYLPVYDGACLADTASGLIAQTCNSSDENQQWEWDSPGYYQFSNEATGLCLNAGTGAGGGVTAQSCGNSTYAYSEMWDVNTFGGYIQTVDPEPSQANLCLTANLVLVECGVDLSEYFDYPVIVF